MGGQKRIGAKLLPCHKWVAWTLASLDHPLLTNAGIRFEPIYLFEATVVPLHYTPCTGYCRLGQGDPSLGDLDMGELTFDAMEHQNIFGVWLVWKIL